MTLDFVGELPYTNGRADDTGSGAARSDHPRRANATEACMNVTRPSRLVRPSPESSPGATGSDRGTDVVTVYPERGSNPHVSKRHEILRSLPVEAAPLPTKLHRDGTATSSTAHWPELNPNVAPTFPEKSPDIDRAMDARGDTLEAGKRCPRCRETKSLDQFARRGNRPNGRQAHCRPCSTLNLAEWRNRPGNRERHNASIAASGQRNPEKVRARARLNYAVARGRVVRGTCEVGGECSGSVHAHHDDYSKPLDVRWLCRTHHEALHHQGVAA